MQNKYNIYDTQSTSSYINQMLMVGVLTSSALGYSSETHFYLKDTLSQDNLQVEASVTTAQNQTQTFLEDAQSQVKAANFNFLKVDEDLDKKIDRYLATYTSDEKEILNI